MLRAKESSSSDALRKKVKRRLFWLRRKPAVVIALALYLCVFGYFVFQASPRRATPHSPAPEPEGVVEERRTDAPVVADGDNRADGTKPGSSADGAKQRFDRQLTDLLGKQRAIVFVRERLREAAARHFSCGGTKHVKLNSARDIARNHPNLDTLLPEADLTESIHNATIRNENFTSCAVVGNSGSLLESQHGEAIDKAEVVIRFNAVVTEGYEQFVGTRTTFRVFNRPQSADRYGASASAGEASLTILRDNGDLRSWARASRALDFLQRSRTFLLDFEFLCHCWRLVHRKGEKPSSGLIGIVLALHLCPKQSIDVYGFRSSDYFGESRRPHYYDWERPQKGRERIHPFSQERKFLQALSDHHYLALH